MAVAIPYLMIAAAGVTAVAAIQQGQAARAASKYNSAVQMQNAQLARAEAQRVHEQQSRENYLRLGAINAAAGKSGGSASEGSVLDVIGDVAAQGELQKQRILLGGELKARDYTNTAILDEFEGKQAQTSSYFKASGALLGGASSAYSGALTRSGTGTSLSSGFSSQG